MKKIILLILAALCAFSMLTACGDGDPVNTDGNGTDTKQGGVSDDGSSDPGDNTDSKLPAKLIYVSPNGTTVEMNVPADAVIAALGEPKSTYEAPSCAFLGNDYYYDYGSFELSAYDEGGEKFVYSVYLKDDLTETPEGLAIGSPEADVAALYGESGKQDNGSYTYTTGQTQLNIIIEDGKVAAIEYVALVGE